MKQFEVRVVEHGVYVGTSHRRTSQEAEATARRIRERRPEAGIEIVTIDALAGYTVASRRFA